MARLLNAPVMQPARPLKGILAAARKRHKECSAIMARGVQGKYQARREAEVAQLSHDIELLELLKQKNIELPSL